MTITKENIVTNTKKYFESIEKLGINTEKLVAFIGQDLIKASAFPTDNMPNAFEGGLIDFSLNVTKHLIELNNLLSEPKRMDKSSLIKVGLLFSIGKAKLYEPNKSEWHIKNLGQIYLYNKDLVSMRIGQRSLFYAMSNDITFTEEEAQAILFHDIDDDKMVKGFSSRLARLLKTAIELTIIDKED